MTAMFARPIIAAALVAAIVDASASPSRDPGDPLGAITMPNGVTIAGATMNNPIDQSPGAPHGRFRLAGFRGMTDPNARATLRVPGGSSSRRNWFVRAGSRHYRERPHRERRTSYDRDRRSEEDEPIPRQSFESPEILHDRDPRREQSGVRRS